MIKVDVGKQYNVFCGRVYPCPRPQGQVDYPVEMEDSRRGKHLPSISIQMITSCNDSATSLVVQQSIVSGMSVEAWWPQIKLKRSAEIYLNCTANAIITDCHQVKKIMNLIKQNLPKPPIGFSSSRVPKQDSVQQNTSSITALPK